DVFRFRTCLGSDSESLRKSTPTLIYGVILIICLTASLSAVPDAMKIRKTLSWTVDFHLREGDCEGKKDDLLR
ncbi:hypothetical protein CDAR_524131, partial [Caerostris darwini]